jgi:hypothetical protein
MIRTLFSAWGLGKIGFRPNILRRQWLYLRDAKEKFKRKFINHDVAAQRPV